MAYHMPLFLIKYKTSFLQGNESLRMDHDMNDIESEGFDGKDMQRNASGFSDKEITMTEPLLGRRRNTTSQIAIVGANVCPIESLDYE